MTKEPKAAKAAKPEADATKRYRMPEKSVEWKATKYDTFKLVKLGEYRQQKGSARSECFAMAKDGMTVATWTKKCAEAGFDAVFAVNCVQKLMGAKEPGWGFSEKNADNLTYEEVKGSRSEANAKAKKDKKAAKDDKAAKKAAKSDKPAGTGKKKATADAATAQGGSGEA